MTRISNGLVGIVNLLTLLASFPVIGIAVWFRLQAATECERFLHLPLLVAGVFLFVASVLGFVGACFRVSSFLWVYLFLLFVLILGMIVFTVFAAAVTNKDAGGVLLGTAGHGEYLGDYSQWLQRRVVDTRNWKVIEGCIDQAGICFKLEGELGMKATNFYKTNLWPVQSGCCKPLAKCGFTKVNATVWTIPDSGAGAGAGASASSEDCKKWSNEQGRLCYSCSSCKAGFLAVFHDGWKKIAIFNAALLGFLVICYTIGCCALRNNRNHHYSKNYYKSAYAYY